MSGGTTVSGIHPARRSGTGVSPGICGSISVLTITTDGTVVVLGGFRGVGRKILTGDPVVVSVQPFRIARHGVVGPLSLLLRGEILTVTIRGLRRGQARQW